MCVCVWLSHQDLAICGPCQLEVALVSPIYHLTSSNYGYNMLQLPQSQGFPRYLFLFAPTYLFGGPTQGRDTMTAQFPRVIIMIPMVLVAGDISRFWTRLNFIAYPFTSPLFGWSIHPSVDDCWCLIIRVRNQNQPIPLYLEKSYPLWKFPLFDSSMSSHFFEHLASPGIPTGLECIWGGFGRSFGSMTGKFTGPPYNSW